MQNLFVKFLVLGSVIGSSCFVVWKAHDGLKTAADQMNPSEFVALEPEATAEKKIEEPAATADWGSPLKLTGANDAPELLPTPAAPAQHENTRSEEAALGLPLDPLAATAPASAAPQQKEEEEVEGALPLFFKDPSDSPSSASTRSMPPLQSEEKEAGKMSEGDDPFAGAPVQAEPEPTLALQKADESQEFVELPGQQVEHMPTQAADAPALPDSEPLPLLAGDLPSAQAKAGEFPASSFAAPPQAQADSMPAVSAAAPHMPVLTKLDGPMAEPVLLPVDPKLPLAIPDRNNSEIVNAVGQMGAAPEIQKASGSLTLPVPVKASLEEAALKSPKQLPRLEDMVAKSRIPTTAAEVEEVDAFGQKMAAAPKPNATQALPVEPLPTLRSSPGLFPDESRAHPERGLESVPELPGLTPVRPSRDVPVFPEATPVLPEAAPAQPESAAPSMPPLPPSGEVLPDPIPSSPSSTAPPQGLELPAPRTPAKAPTPMEVLPLSDLPIQPAPTPVEMPAQKGLEQKEVVPQPGMSAPDPFGGMPAAPVPTPHQEVLPEPMPALPPVSPMDPSAPAVNPTSIPAIIPAPTTPKGSPAPIGSPAPTAAPHLLMGTGNPDASAPQGPQSPELKIEKIAPTEAEVGEPVVYAILIRNVGGSTAKDVVVEDRIPRGTQLEGTIPQAYLNDGKLSWQLGTIEPGAERKIQLKVVPMEAGQIGSVATVSFAAAVSASIKVNAPRLSISMDGPQESAVGEPMNFHFKLKNSGESPAKAVFLRALLPSGLTHPGGNDLEYESGLIAPGEEKDIHLVVQAEKAGHYVIQAQVTNDGKSHADTQSAINVIKSRLEITRTGTENRFVGRPARFVLRVANTSSEELQGVVLRETLASGVELPEIPTGGQWDPKTRLLTWRFGLLKPGEAREVTAAYTPQVSGEHHGTLVAVDGAGHQSTLETVLNAKGFSELTPHYQVDQRTVMVNERVTLQVTLENAGTAASRNVRAQFILPEGVEFVSAQGPGEHRAGSNQVVFASLNEFTPGSKETFHLAVVPHQEGTMKVTFKLEADDYSEPVFQDQAIRVVPAGQ